MVLKIILKMSEITTKKIKKILGTTKAYDLIAKRDNKK